MVRIKLRAMGGPGCAGRDRIERAAGLWLCCGGHGGAGARPWGWGGGPRLARARAKKPVAAGLFGLAAFAKETTLPFLAAAFVAELLSDRKPKVLAAHLAGGVAYA